MSIESDGTVRHEVLVDLPQERAFWAFADLDRIKPREHNLLGVPIAATVLEQHSGGDVYDRGVTAASAGGAGCSSSTPTTRSLSAETSDQTGKSPPNQRGRGQTSPPSVKSRHGCAWCIATTRTTAQGGSRCETAWTRPTGGRSIWPATRR
jgi:hypothetical protein